MEGEISYFLCAELTGLSGLLELRSSFGLTSFCFFFCLALNVMFRWGNVENESFFLLELNSSRCPILS